MTNGMLITFSPKKAKMSEVSLGLHVLPTEGEGLGSGRMSGELRELFDRANQSHKRRVRN